MAANGCLGKGFTLRQIVLDTETTGFRFSDGDKIVEIGCVELENFLPTGNTFHQYINPKRAMPQEAFKVHGLSDQFLEKFPIINDIIDDFLNFIRDDSVLVIHNAQFDMGFLNAELKALGRTQISMSRAIDTVKLAREKFPGAPASLDALCRRFKVDNSGREFHGALLDAELLSEIYLELVGGRQPDFELSDNERTLDTKKKKVMTRAPRSFKVTEKDKMAHKKFLSKLKSPIWFD